MSDAKPRQTLNVDLGELKPLVLDAAKNQGKRPGTWVREAVALALQEHAALPAPMGRTAPNRSRGSAVVHFTARLTEDESEAMRAAAGAEGLSQAEYVARIATGTLVPQRQQAMATLGEITAKLHMLDANLRAMSQHLDSPEVVAALKSTARVVRAQAKRAAEVLDDVSTTRRTAARKDK